MKGEVDHEQWCRCSVVEVWLSHFLRRRRQQRQQQQPQSQQLAEDEAIGADVSIDIPPVESLQAKELEGTSHMRGLIVHEHVRTLIDLVWVQIISRDELK